MPPDPNQCPECEAKIILNGDVARANLKSICELIERQLDNGKEFDNVRRVLVQANLVEDEVDKFRRIVLEEFGFEGPWPQSLDRL